MGNTTRQKTKRKENDPMGKLLKIIVRWFKRAPTNIRVRNLVFDMSEPRHESKSNPEIFR